MLQVTKTGMYLLTANQLNLLEWAQRPTPQGAQFYKSFGRREYHLDWSADGDRYHAVLSECGENALLAVEREHNHRIANREIARISADMLQKRNLITTAEMV